MTKQDIYQAIGEEKAHELYFNLLQGPIQVRPLVFNFHEVFFIFLSIYN